MLVEGTWPHHIVGWSPVIICVPREWREAHLLRPSAPPAPKVKPIILIDFHRFGTRIKERGENRNSGGTETVTVKLVAS